MADKLIAAFKSDERCSEVAAELVNLEFAAGYESYSRPALIITGPNGKAEASPLTGYFDDVQLCVSGAISSVLEDRPNALRDSVPINQLVANESDILRLNNPDAVKVKVADIQDADLVKKVREHVGNTVPIRIDCNGNFNVDDAEKLLAALSGVRLEFVEQPCKTIEENAALRKIIDIPLALDESACTTSDIEEIKSLDAADIIVVKVQSSGGINAAAEIINYWGSDVVVSSMMESEVGVNLGIELAKSVEKLPYACGLSKSPIAQVINEPVNIV